MTLKNRIEKLEAKNKPPVKIKVSHSTKHETLSQIRRRQACASREGKILIVISRKVIDAG